jgi:hypothetical protein
MITKDPGAIGRWVNADMGGWRVLVPGWAGYSSVTTTSQRCRGR